ncbi:hypothetical protein JHK85_036963 [Glycine max]|nr:hypothetical protein JHK85_036963 [Glycine max]
MLCICASRFQDEAETNKLMYNKESHLPMVSFDEVSDKQKGGKDAIGKSSDGRELSRVFSEDYDAAEILVLDPRGHRVNTWNKIFLAACLLSLFVDPLFFYLPVAKKDKCIDMSTGLEVFLTIIRSLIDAFYIIQIYFRFQTAYIAPSSRVSGRGELIIDSSKIASKYMRRDFWLDVMAAQPLPQYRYLDCQSMGDPDRIVWLRSSNLSRLCDQNSDFFQFGIFVDALNLETYLQSTTTRLEEWRIRRTDTERWMHHRQLPRYLKQNVRRHEQFRWVATRGVDEETILRDLPIDLRRDIKRHLCLNLVRQVPLFDHMDERMLDAICERLKPSLFTPGACVVREGDLVNEMLFIVRGRLDSCTTNGGRTGFFNTCRLGSGDFCGEELLPWTLDPRPTVVLPSSTRTVKSITEVEAFALIAGDLKFVAAQFRRLHSKQLRHTFRFHSHQWRTWAACFIQAAWFRYKRTKETSELKKKENLMMAFVLGTGSEHFSAPLQSPKGTMYAAKLASSPRKGRSLRYGPELDILGSLRKPLEPDFTDDDDS